MNIETLAMIALLIVVVMMLMKKESAEVSKNYKDFITTCMKKAKETAITECNKSAVSEGISMK